MNNLGGNTMGQQGQAAGAGQKEDYVDKALDSVERKLGIRQNRAVNESITDKARGFFEKITGKRVPSKISN